MSYREKIKQYQDNQLPQEERAQIEAEIEKVDAITEYLEEKLEAELEMCEIPGDKQRQTPEDAFDQSVQKSVRRSFRNMGLTVGAVLLVVVLFVQFGLSPLMSLFYYNPTKAERVSGEGFEFSYTQLEKDWNIYQDLTLPFRGHDYIQAISLGYGNYSLVIQPTVSYGMGVGRSFGGQIRRGRMELYDPDYLKDISTNLFACYGMEPDQDWRGQMSALEERGRNESTEETGISYTQWYYTSLEDAEKAVEDLDENKLYRAVVSFSRKLSFTEVNVLLCGLTERQDSRIVNPWLAVFTDEASYLQNSLGYHWDQTGNEGTLPVAYNKTYPYLTLEEQDGYTEEDYNKIQERRNDEQIMTAHMTSMLRYLSDRSSFLNLLEKESAHKDRFSKAAAYIEQNGLAYYGFTCLAAKQDLQAMLAQEQILGIVPLEWE